MRAHFVAHSAISLAILSSGSTGYAQSSSQAVGTAAVEILEPTMLENVSDLDFATISVSGPGTATINPNNDAMSVTGGVNSAGGTPKAALFQIMPLRRGSVFINVPQVPIVLTRISGTETMTVGNWTVSSNIGTIGKGRHHVSAGTTPIQFRIGGTLNVQSNQVPGSYVGTFNVTAEYP